LTVAVGAGLSLDSLSADGDPGEYLEATGYSETEPPPLQDEPAYAYRVYGRVVDDGRSGKLSAGVMTDKTALLIGLLATELGFNFNFPAR
jgi:hypothetical protein